MQLEFFLQNVLFLVPEIEHKYIKNKINKQINFTQLSKDLFLVTNVKINQRRRILIPIFQQKCEYLDIVRGRIYVHYAKTMKGNSLTDLINHSIKYESYLQYYSILYGELSEHLHIQENTTLKDLKINEIKEFKNYTDLTKYEDLVKMNKTIF